MKKKENIFNTTIGICIATVIPFVITAILQALKLNDRIINLLNRNDMQPYYVVFFISISLFVVLITRKIYMDKSKQINTAIEGLKEYIDERLKNSDTITDYTFSKNKEQFQIITNMFNKVSNGTITSMKSPKKTDSEKVLLKKLSEYEIKRLNDIYGKLNIDFNIEK